MILVGLIGYKQSGKDTCADYLVEKYGFHKYAFAEPVKQVCKIMFQLDSQQLQDATQKEENDSRWDMTPRQMMQQVGTDMVRHYWGENFWVRCMEMRVGKEKKDRVVVSDVRFQNEADWIKQNHGILVRIVDSTQSIHMDPHPSEVEQLSIQEDLLLSNKKDASFFQEIESTLSFLFV